MKLKQFSLSALVAMLFIVFGLQSASTQAQPKLDAKPTPALWKLTDHDSEIYLFGTVHALFEWSKWRNQKIDAAFGSAQTIFFEAPAGADSPQTIQKLLQKHGFNPPGVTLSSYLNRKEKSKLNEAYRTLGVTSNKQAFEPMRPWLVGVSLATVQLQKQGASPDLGVEKILRTSANSLGKGIQYLETDEQQIKILSSMTREDEVAFLIDGLQAVIEDPDQMTEMVSAWRIGDTQTLSDIMKDSFAGKPAVYQSLIVGRNQDWANQIKTLLDSSGTSFIAVGALHLVGPDSVQNQLAQKGLNVTRQ
jgi:uncharacterized protein YbaP (TraB family)